MALIKRADSNTVARQALVLDLGDLEGQADRLKDLATREAERIIAEAHAERARLIAGAKEEGFAAGFAKGLEEGRVKGEADGETKAIAAMRDRLIALDQAWTHALDELLGARERFMQEARISTLRLAIAIAERVVKRTIEADDQTVVRQAAEALQLAANGSRVVLEVHPDDAQTLERALPEMMRRMARGEHAEVVEDESLERGSCVIRSPQCGSIDASIGVQLDRLVETLLPGERRESREDPRERRRLGDAA